MRECVSTRDSLTVLGSVCVCVCGRGYIITIFTRQEQPVTFVG